MLDKLRLVEERYLEMEARAAQPEFYADPKAAARLLREQKQLEPIMTAYRAYLKTQQELDDVLDMMRGDQDAEMKALCQEEFQTAKKRLGRRGERAVCTQPVPNVQHVRRIARLARGAAQLQRNGAWRRKRS